LRDAASRTSPALLAAASVAVLRAGSGAVRGAVFSAFSAVAAPAGVASPLRSCAARLCAGRDVVDADVERLAGLDVDAAPVAAFGLAAVRGFVAAFGVLAAVVAFVPAADRGVLLAAVALPAAAVGFLADVPVAGLVAPALRLPAPAAGFLAAVELPATERFARSVVVVPAAVVPVRDAERVAGLVAADPAPRDVAVALLEDAARPGLRPEDVAASPACVRA
jgi:hypothetical protein